MTHPIILGGERAGEITIISPIEPHHLDKKQRFHFEDLCQRVTTASVIQGRGRDLLLRVYLAGLYHGIEVGAEYQKQRTES